MMFDAEWKRTFSMPAQQIAMMLIVLALVLTGGTFLAAQIQTVFSANVYLNAFIGFVFLVGVLTTFWQTAQIIAAVRWLRSLQTGFSGHEFAKPPRLVASMAPLLREGRMKKRITAVSTRSILDSIAVRLDEARDITRYIINFLIFLGLLGTFWGLSLTVPAVVDTIRNLAPQQGDASETDVFARLMSGLENQLGGMGTAFASSLVGLAGSLVVGLLELFAGHGQNRFYRELEEWLTSFTRLGAITEGDTRESALIALLDKVDEGLEKTAEFTARAEAARIKAEDRIGAVAEVIGALAKEMQTERETVAELIGEMRKARSGEPDGEREALAVLKRMEHSGLATAQAVAQIANAPSRGGAESLEAQLRFLTQDIAVGRGETIAAIRSEMRALIDLIDQRTRHDG